MRVITLVVGTDQCLLTAGHLLYHVGGGTTSHDQRYVEILTSTKRHKNRRMLMLFKTAPSSTGIVFIQKQKIPT